MRTFFGALKIVSAMTLFFFSWTFLPLWQVAAYAADTGQGAESKGQSAEKRRAVDSAPPTASGRFEKALDDIRQKLRWAGDKIREGVEPAPEIEALKSRKAEIESIDSELKSEFSATEKKLKDAHLPQEILERHYAFVRHYQDNLKELVANLEQVERAETKADVDAAVEKARKHLEKLKPPTKHVPLDPNNLPFRARKAGKIREPRTQEQFEKDFSRQKSQGKRRIASSRLLPDLLAGRAQYKPVLLAFNGPASDVPLQLLLPSEDNVGSAPEWFYHGVRGGPNQKSETGDLQPQIAFSDSSPFLLAQAADQPSADDLAETPDVQFTDAIRAKAQELGNSPLKIYEWVRNNIEYAPTYGSIQGADMCLQSKICNDFDTASLLISLLRVSGIYAHYEYSTIEIPIEKAMNWVGGVTDPKMAGTILATNGIPVKVLVSGGTIKAVQLEHVYVKAWVDYIPSRGAVHKQGDTWIPLDASYKQYNYTQGIDVASAVPFDAQTFANQILSTATTNTVDGSVTNVDSAYVRQTMQNYQTQVQNYIQQNYPNATVGDVIGKKEIIQQNYPILLGTLPYKAIQVGSEFSTVPDNLRETMSFSIPDPTGATVGLTYTTGMPQIAGKKITLSFSPSTANDQAVIESLLPQPHADGTPIQPSELPSSFPAYLINLKPELRIDGQIVATGAPGMMGSALPFTMSLNEPGIGLSNIDNITQIGEYYAIELDTGRIGVENLGQLKTKLAATKTELEEHSFVGLTKDDLAGDILYSTIAEYFVELDFSDEIRAKSIGIIRHRVSSIGMFSFSLSVTELFGMPKLVTFAGLKMDVDRIMQAVFSKDGNIDKVKQYMLASGMMSSVLEHAVPEQLLSTTDDPATGLSAVKALQIANNQGIPIYTIDQENINAVLSQLRLDATVVSDIQNAVNAGKIVTVSRSNITLNGWTGCGYIIIDPTTDVGAYMISGNLSGSWILLGAISGALIGLGIVIAGAFLTAGGLPIIIGVLAAALIGLGIGVFLSQVLSEDAKTQLGQVLRQFIRTMLPVMAGLGFTIALAVMAIALYYFVLDEIFKQTALIRGSKIYLAKDEGTGCLEVRNVF